MICVGESTDTSRMRSSLAGVPMKKRPPVSVDVSSTASTVSPACASAVRKHPSANSASVNSKRGAKTM
jgi:hypothetical protein